MTVLAVKKYKDRIVMGCDSQTSWGDSYKENDKSDTLLNTSKIFSQNGLVIGVSGRCRDNGYLRIFSRNHKPREASVEGIIDFMSEFIDWCKKKDSNYQPHMGCLVVFENKVFWTINLEVMEVKDYYAHGSGMFLALAALYFGKSVKSAIEVAKKFDMHCSGDTHIVEVRIQQS